MSLETRYHELRREATVLAGEPADIPQRAALLHEIFLDSAGNHGFAEIAAHGALWGFATSAIPPNECATPAEVSSGPNKPAGNGFRRRCKGTMSWTATFSFGSRNSSAS